MYGGQFMKSWFDLTKQEQNSLKNEFDSKNKILDLRIGLYIFAFFWFFLFLMPLISILSGGISLSGSNGSNDTAIQNAIIFGVIFGICFLLAIINSLMVSKHEKEFKTWLRLRNIEK